MDISNIDRLHEGKMQVISSQHLGAIYAAIKRSPLQYLVANGYLTRFVLFHALPFLVVFSSYQNIIAPYHPGVIVRALFELFFIWIWFSKNTCYVLMKCSLIVCACFLFTNYGYFLTGTLSSYRYVKIMLFFVLVIISVIFINDTIFHSI